MLQCNSLKAAPCWFLSSFFHYQVICVWCTFLGIHWLAQTRLFYYFTVCTQMRGCWCAMMWKLKNGLSTQWLILNRKTVTIVGFTAWWCVLISKQKKTCIYIMLYPNFSVFFFYVTFHFNFFLLFHFFKMKPLLQSITVLTFFFTCMQYIIFSVCWKIFQQRANHQHS